MNTTFSPFYADSRKEKRPPKQPLIKFFQSLECETTVAFTMCDNFFLEKYFFHPKFIFSFRDYFLK